MFVDKLLKMLCAKLNDNVMLIITTSKNHLLVLFNAYQYCSMQGYFSLIRFKFKLVLLFPMSDEVYFIDLQFYMYVLQIVVCQFVLFLLAIVLSVLLRCTYSDYLPLVSSNSYFRNASCALKLISTFLLLNLQSCPMYFLGNCIHRQLEGKTLKIRDYQALMQFLKSIGISLP